MNVCGGERDSKEKGRGTVNMLHSAHCSLCRRLRFKCVVETLHFLVLEGNCV